MTTLQRSAAYVAEFLNDELKHRILPCHSLSAESLKSFEHLWYSVCDVDAAGWDGPFAKFADVALLPLATGLKWELEKLLGDRDYLAFYPLCDTGPLDSEDVLVKEGLVHVSARMPDRELIIEVRFLISNKPE